jgi:peptidoglycan LD-endopeptidase LytH
MRLGVPILVPLTAALWISVVGCGAVTTLSEVTGFRPAPEPPSPLDPSDLAIDEDLSQLQAMMRHDLDRFSTRESERAALPPVSVSTPSAADAQPQQAMNPLRGDFLSTLMMPVVGVSSYELEDSFGASRDGGRRRHRGIDIFAERGSEVVAVTGGTISFIGEQRKAGRCLWLVTEAGVAFFYAHLDRWAPGIYEGMHVRAGDLVGFVGNTGNAIHTSTHLHFAVIRNDEALDPYPILVRSVRAPHPPPALAGGFGISTQ